MSYTLHVSHSSDILLRNATRLSRHYIHIQEVKVDFSSQVTTASAAVLYVRGTLRELLGPSPTTQKGLPFYSPKKAMQR